MAAFQAVHSFSKNSHSNVIKRRIVLTRDMLIQNSYNLLIIVLAADGGWPPVTLP